MSEVPLRGEKNSPHFNIFAKACGKLYMMVGFFNLSGKVNYSL